MNKETVIQRILDTGIVAVVRAGTQEAAFRIVDACIEGGVSAVEITFTVPFAHKVIEGLALRYGDEIVLGAGTVLDPETARISILSGACYVVSPCFHADTVRLCNRYRTPIMPGIMTIAEAVSAMEAGADILKLFPGDALGPSFIKAISGPLPQARLMPTGGVDVNNVAQWIEAGAVAVGAGGCLTKGDITANAKAFVENIKAARQSMKAD